MASSDRRQFLRSLMAGSLLAGYRSDRDAAVQVEAQSTVFYGQPDGQRNLIRFFVSGVDAPAGRLRVFDRSAQLVGTAGVIAYGDGRLYGELWLSLGAGTRISSELAAPGLRAPVRTHHTLAAGTRWTIHWITVLSATRLAQALGSLPPLRRAVATAALQQAGAAVNPASRDIWPAAGDVPCLRMAEAALLAGRSAGLPLAPVAVLDASDALLPTLPVLLNGTRTAALLLLDATAPGVSSWQAADGSRVLVASLPAGSDPESVGLLAGGAAMMRRVEQWLGTAPLGLPRDPPSSNPGTIPAATAVVVGTSVDRVAAASQIAAEWNGRFTHPRIVIGRAEDFVSALQGRAAVAAVEWKPGHASLTVPPSLDALQGQAAARAAERQRRADGMVGALVDLLPTGGTGLDFVARQLAFSLPGTLVFNPSPFARSEAVLMADGSTRVTTDVPAMGYAYFPLGEGGGWAPAAGSQDLVLESAALRITVDPDSGAVQSLITLADGIEWVGKRPGLNAVSGSRLERTTRQTLPGVGVRVHLERRTSGGATVSSVVTLYDQLPWMDIQNDARPEDGEAWAYGFTFGPPREITWELPAGVGRGTAPGDIAYLRWIRLLSESGSIVFASADSGVAHADADGALTSYAAPGTARYRIAVNPAGSLEPAEAPWRMGWSVEPLLTASVPGTGGAALPSFGSLILVDQAAVAVVGLQRARDGDGLIAYVQELSGRGRIATLGGGIIGFRGARLVDFLERDLGAPPMVMTNGVGVPLRPGGVTAVRLQEPRLVGA